MRTQNITKNIAKDLDEVRIEELLNSYTDTEFLNFTLESGRIGYALLFLYQYEKYKENKYLDIAKSIIFKDVCYNKNVCLFYGLSGLVLAQLYYFYITKDESVLKRINSNIIEIICHTKIFHQKNFMNPLFKDGVGGIIYLYSILKYSNENVLFENMLLGLNKYVNEYLKSEKEIIDYSEICIVYSIIEDFSSNENLVLQKNSIGLLKANNFIINETCNNINKLLFKHILRLSSTNQIAIDLDINQVCSKTIQQYFPRTVDYIGPEYNYAKHFKNSSIEIVNHFCESFNWSDEISASFYSFEKSKFLYELELRDLSITELIKRNNEEVQINIDHLSLCDDDFLRQYFKCSNDIRLIETKHYKTLEIEEDILDANTYIIALKPRTIPFNKLNISECCLEDSFRLIISFSKMEEPITGQDIVEIAYELDESINYNIVKAYVVKTLRKLVLYRLLTIECGNRKAIIE